MYVCMQVLVPLFVLSWDWRSINVWTSVINRSWCKQIK